MKIRFHYITAIAAIALLASCKKDNYDAPSSTLSGKLVYQGQTFGLEKEQVAFELYQYGFGKVGAIGSTFTQDGTYSALLFDGEYKLIIPNGQGPFMWKKTATGNPDSVTINLKGTQTVDLEVTPYYLISNAQLAASGGNVNASFGLQKVITDANAKDVEEVTLYINKTQFVSAGNNIAATSKGAADITDPASIALSVDIPDMTPTQNYVFARVGLKIAGVEDRIFSPLVKITF